VANAKKQATPHVRYLAKRGHCVLKGVGINTEPPTLEKAGAPLPLGWEAWLIPRNKPSPYMLPCWMWAFYVIGCRHKQRRTSKIGERWGQSPLWWGVTDPLEICPSPRVILPNLVVLGQAVQA